jgi:hypothetical protein
MTDVSDVPIFDDGDEEEVDSKTRRIRFQKEWYDDSASQLPQSFGFSDDRDLRGISVTSEHTSKRVAALENVPHAERVINAVLSAFIITFLRPPMDAV